MALQPPQPPQAPKTPIETKDGRSPKAPRAPQSPQHFQTYQTPQMPVPIIGTPEYLGLLDPTSSGAFQHYWSIPVDVDGGLSAFPGAYFEVRNQGSSDSYQQIRFAYVAGNGGAFQWSYGTPAITLDIRCGWDADETDTPIPIPRIKSSIRSVALSA